MSDPRVEALRAEGYLVFKPPACDRQGKGHGRHTLMTRSAMCDGEEPKPHGFHKLNQGSFGLWIGCACGEEFADYTISADPAQLTPWQAHKAKYGIEGRTT